MRYVATLISTPQRPVVTQALAARVADTLPHARPAAWLAPGLAVDIFFDIAPQPGATAGVLKKLAEEVRGVIGAAPVDLVVQPERDRRKALLVADMDSTMIGQECIDELADYAGFKERVA